MQAHMAGQGNGNRIADLGVLGNLPIKDSQPGVSGPADAAGGPFPLELVPVREGLQPGPFPDGQ